MASDLTRNGRLSGLLRRIGDSWQGLAALGVIATLVLAGWGKIKTVAQVPAKLDSLRFSRDTQTAILRRSERSVSRKEGELHLKLTDPSQEDQLRLHISG